jgi:hypothetical protein
VNRNLVLEALRPFGGARFVQKDPDIERVVTFVSNRDTVFVINRIGIVAVRAGVGICHGVGRDYLHFISLSSSYFVTKIQRKTLAVGQQPDNINVRRCKVGT